jgi:hypothetical protein
MDFRQQIESKLYQKLAEDYGREPWGFTRVNFLNTQVSHSISYGVAALSMSIILLFI